MTASVQPQPCNPDAPVCTLTGPTSGHGTVFTLQVSPDSTHVVYRADTEQGKVELFSVPVNGGAVRRLSTPLGPGGFVGIVIVSPDSKRVVYGAALSSGEPAALYSVPIGGPASASVRLADDVAETETPDATLPGFQVSGNSRTVVYLPPGRREVRAVPIGGPQDASVRLTGPFAPGGRAGRVEISPDSQRVFYIAEQDPVTTPALYRVPLRPPDPAGLSTIRMSRSGVSVIDFALSTQDRAVVYHGESDGEGSGLYRVPFSGSVSRRISHDLPPNWKIARSLWKITPNGERIVYHIAQEFPNGAVERQMHSAPTSGPRSSVRLDRLPGKLNTFFGVSSDSSRVVYLMNFGSLPVVELFSVSVTGPVSARVQLNEEPIAVFLALSPDGSRVVYYSDLPDAVYSVPIDGPASASVRLNQSEHLDAEPLVSSDSTRVVYQGQADGGRSDVYSVPIDGNGQRSRPTAEIDDPIIARMLLTPNGRRAVYSATHGFEDPNSLYSSPLTFQVSNP
jgi:Tol biopolymer transport system component